MASTTERPSSPSSRPTRRALLAGAALAAPAAVLPAVVRAAPAGPDLHLAWSAEWRILVDWCDSSTGERDLDEFPQWHRSVELERLIAKTPAATLAGAVAQLRLLRHFVEEVGPGSEVERAGRANALATLERLAGEGVT
jgi:hypothetical protein